MRGGGWGVVTQFSHTILYAHRAGTLPVLLFSARPLFLHRLSAWM